MDIFQLKIDDLDTYKEEIQALLKEATAHSFPNNLPEENYYGKRVEDLKEYLSNNKAVAFLLVEDDVLLGWAWCHQIFRFNKNHLHVASIAVKPGFRNKGYGSRLFAKIERYARMNGYDGIDLLVTAGNQPAVQFYDTMDMVVERYMMSKDF